MRAAGHKRIAEVAYWLSQAPDADPERRAALVTECVEHLEHALHRYTTAIDVMLSKSEVQRKSSFHWLATAALLMQALLGRDLDEELRRIAARTARIDRDQSHPGTSCWALVSFIELGMLELVAGTVDDVEETVDDLVDLARRVVGTMGHDAEQVDARHAVSCDGTCDGGPTRAFAGTLADAGVGPSEWPDATPARRAAQTLLEIFTPRAGAADGGPRPAAAPTATPRAWRPLQRQDPPGGPPPVTARHGTFPRRHGPRRSRRLPVGVLRRCRRRRRGRLRHVLIDCGPRGAWELAAEQSARSAPRRAVRPHAHRRRPHRRGDPAVPRPRRRRPVRRRVVQRLEADSGASSAFPQGEEFTEAIDRDDRPFAWNRERSAAATPGPIVTDGVHHPGGDAGGWAAAHRLTPTERGLEKLARHWRSALADRKEMLGRARPEPVDRPVCRFDLAALARSGPRHRPQRAQPEQHRTARRVRRPAVLFTGDAHADELVASIRTLQTSRGAEGVPLRLDALKLSHHGSAGATTEELLDAIDCQNFLVSTDGGIFYHPDRAAIARVLVHRRRAEAPVTLHFNHRSEFNGLWDDPGLRDRYRYDTVYPGSEVDAGLRVDL